jgi:hypothetical protein
VADQIEQVEQAEHARLVRVRIVLDWRESRHFAKEKRPCRICRTLTFLRDDQGRPCDKTCAEEELAAEYLRQHSAYFADERARPVGEVRPR